MEEVDPSASAKMALAVALLRSRDPRPDLAEDVQHWKKKAKERKIELLQLKDELKDIQDQMLQEYFQNTTYCKCYFFENCTDTARTPLQHVYWEEGKDLVQLNIDYPKKPATEVVEFTLQNHTHILVKHTLSNGDEEKFCVAADFLVELVNNHSIVVSEPAFATLAHQALEIILASIKELLLNNYTQELLAEVTNRLISHLLRRMCSSTVLDGTSGSDDVQFQVQHLIRKLGAEPYIAKRTLLLVTQRVCALADSLHSMDPFDDAFPNVHDSMFMMFRLMEFLVSDCLYDWITKGLEKELFEESLRWLMQSKKSLELLENRNCLYIIQLDRVVGELAKQVGRVPRADVEKLINMEILESLLQ